MSAARSATFSEAPAVAQLRDGPVRFTLRRSTRARTIRVVLHPDARGVVVTVPGSRVGEVEAERRAVAFLRDREPWLRRHLRTQAATRARIAARGGAQDGGVVPYLGRLHRVRVVPAVVGQPRSDVVAFDGEEGRPDELVIHRADRDRRADAVVLEAWFRQRATEAIATAIDRHLIALNVPRPVFALRDPRARWGSASPEGRLSFSWRLILAPPSALDTVVVHELAHLRAFGHGPKFWAIVASRRPDHAVWRRWLHDHSADLHAALELPAIAPGPA